MQLTLIRHPPVIADGLCYGQSEIPLVTGEPDLTIAKLAKTLPADIDSIITSPLSRCRLLAEGLAKGKPIVLVPEIMEVNFGDWEQEKWNEITQAQLTPWMEDFVHQAPPAGESLKQMNQRVVKYLESLRGGANTGSHTILISHAGPIRCIIAHLLHVPLDQIFKIQIKHSTPIKLKLDTNPELDQIWL